MRVGKTKTTIGQSQEEKNKKNKDAIGQSQEEPNQCWTSESSIVPLWFLSIDAKTWWSSTSEICSPTESPNLQAKHMFDIK